MIPRRARPDDAPALAEILSDWIDETPWMPRLHTRDEDRGFVAGLIGRNDTWTNEALSGFISRQGDEITALYLAPAARGRGLGARFLGAARQGQRRLTLWTFQANARAMAFYAREGFVEAARTSGDNEERLPDIRMIWETRT